MSYKNNTYVIFDGDEDMWAYAYMKGWKNNQNIDFDFHDAHDLNTITNRSQEENTKKKLRARLSNAKQAIVLVGEKTKNLYRFVRWEIEVCQGLSLPIVVANLNEKRVCDSDRCPPILKNADAVHVAFKMKIIKHALDNFCPNYSNYAGKGDDWHYNDDIYKGLGL